MPSGFVIPVIAYIEMLNLVCTGIFHMLLEHLYINELIENILLTTQDVVKLADFGFARISSTFFINNTLIYLAIKITYLSV